MNIAVITDNFYPVTGGITTTLLNFLDKMTTLGHKVFIFNNSYNGKTCFWIIHYAETFKKYFFHQKKSFYFFLIQIFFRNLFCFKGLKFKDRVKTALYNAFYPDDIVNRVKSVKNLVSYFKKYKIDVILSASSSYPLFYSFILSKWFNIPLTTLAHGEDFLKKYTLNMNTTIFQNLEKIIVSNKIMKRLFLKIHNVKDEKLEIIFRGVNIEKVIIRESKEQLRDKLNIPQKDFIILTVSRLHYRKGIKTIINALKQIIDENPKVPIKYYIIGTGPEEESLKNLVLELKLEKYIKLLGRINDNLRNKYYKLSDLFILVPELKRDRILPKNISIEGFGIIYLEANYFKLPVIGSLSGGIKKAIKDGKTGYLINPNDEIGLKEKIMLLFNNEKMRNDLGNFGHERVIEFFNWDNIALDYQKILNHIIKEYNYDKK